MGDSTLRSGVQFDPKTGEGFPFTEQDQDYDNPDNEAVTARVTGSEALSGVDQNPTDRAAAKVRRYDLSGIQAKFTSIFYRRAFRLQRINLPRELTALAVVENSGIATGVGNHPISQQGFSFTSGSGQLSPRASAESSASASFELLPTWRPVRSENGPAIAYGFYVVGDVTEAAILTALATASLANASVTAWPKFKPKIESLVLNGQQASVRASADSNAAASADSSGVVKTLSFEYGDEYSKRLDTAQSVRELPECIHALINLATTSVTKTATVTVKANTVAIVQGMTTHIAAITNEPAARTQDATASITPTSLAATTITTIPSTGLYLYDFNIQDAGYGVVEVTAIVVDMADYV